MAIDRTHSLQGQANILTGTFKAREDRKKPVLTWRKRWTRNFGPSPCPDMEKNLGFSNGQGGAKLFVTYAPQMAKRTK